MKKRWKYKFLFGTCSTSKDLAAIDANVDIFSTTIKLNETQKIMKKCVSSYQWLFIGRILRNEYNMLIRTLDTI